MARSPPGFLQVYLNYQVDTSEESGSPVADNAIVRIEILANHIWKTPYHSLFRKYASKYLQKQCRYQ